jgi:hypothetical protein
MDVFGALAALIAKHGIWVVILVIGLGIFIFRFDKLWAGLAAMVGKISPVWAERRRLDIEQIKARVTAEREQVQHEQATQKERELDTILVLKDMLLAYKTEIDDTKLERRQLANRLYEIVESYERRDAQVVEVLRDMSGLIRAQTARLDRVCRMAEETKQPRV